jgi:uncharacterized protein YaiE (UPF0345 family)
MGTLTYSHTLVAGAAENVNDVQDMFNDVKTIINGNIEDTTNILAPNNATWKNYMSCRTFMVAGQVVGTYIAATGAQAVISTGNLQAAPFIFPNSAELAVPNKVTKLRLVAVCAVNATAPTATFAPQLRSASTVAGGAAAITYSFGGVGASTVTFTTPAANSLQRLEGAEVLLSDLVGSPSVTTFAIVTTTATIAASSLVAFDLSLQYRHI